MLGWWGGGGGAFHLYLVRDVNISAAVSCEKKLVWGVKVWDRGQCDVLRPASAGNFSFYLFVKLFTLTVVLLERDQWKLMEKNPKLLEVKHFVSKLSNTKLNHLTLWRGLLFSNNFRRYWFKLGGFHVTYFYTFHLECSLLYRRRLNSDTSSKKCFHLYTTENAHSVDTVGYFNIGILQPL